MSRSFSIVKVYPNVGSIVNIKEGGRFVSSNPASAAKKAGSSICKNSNVQGVCSFGIDIQETTRGSSNKIFSYTFSRSYNPKTVVRGDKNITYNYETHVHSRK